MSYWADKTAATTDKILPVGEQTRHEFAGSGAGHVSDLTTDGGGEEPTGIGGDLTATADSSSAQAIMATVVLVTVE